jgi:O-antigen ligase
LAILVSLAIGLALPGPAGGSDNPYLRPDNALRLAKGLFAALLLWPFLRQRLRTHGDTMVRFAGGMVAGLCLESLAIGVERALFPGLFDFASDYRVVGTFSSMQFGGGHVGAYLAIALPFLVVGLRRPRLGAVLTVLAAAAVTGYALVVTFARTAYVAAVIGMAVAVLSWAVSTARTGGARAAVVILPLLLLAMVGGIVALATFDSKFMESRFGTIARDLGAREANWAGGLAFRDGTVERAVLGMGLGTYPRVALAHSAPTHGPSNIVVKHEGGAPYLSLTARSSFYLVQHVPIDPRLSYRLTVAVRSPDGASKIGVALCENMLLYSENCRGATQDVPAGTAWREVSVVLGVADHDTTILWGLLRRPVILSLFSGVPGSTIELRDVHLIDTRGRDVLANGNFAAGTKRWIATDDDHLVWRIKNQYLMTLFEGGVLGLGAFLLLSGAALYGAIRAARGGDLAAAAVAGSLMAFLCSSAFDALLEAPRIATLFYIVALLGLESLALRADTRPYRGRPG